MLTEGQEILDGRFKVVKKLGAGAFGEIYKGKYVYAGRSLVVGLPFSKLSQRLRTPGILPSRANLPRRQERKDQNFILTALF